ncbi:MAG: prolyl oligopeptidase family serine peptidase [Chthoniobacteraceae bacterium]
MKTLRILLLSLTLALTHGARAADAPARREWTVDGVSREALVYAPPKAKTEAVPVVFAFHGHGGTMQNAARSFAYHTQWPEALVVYMQGLNTPGRLTDPEGKKPGWQHGAGDQGDRDLKFFDAVLASLKKDYRVDEKRIYSTGHSNGGGFTYLLWAMRGERFAAMAPSAAAAAQTLRLLKPKPVLHVAGEKDTLVKFAWQQQTMDALRKLNECGEGKPWEKGCTVYESKIGAPVVTFIHPGAHGFPREAPGIIVKFFQQHARP